MSSRDPEIAGRSIVLVGRFNPSIFHPQWFARVSLLPSEEADAAAVRIAAPQVANFSTDWFDCLVTLENFQLATLQPEMEDPLLDLALGAFHLLPHTPVWSFGLNSDAHFSIDSVEKWHALGHRLSPKGIWDDVLEDAGTRAVLIQGRREGALHGMTNVRVEPSLRIHPGIYVNVNDHYDLRDVPQTWEETMKWAAEEKQPPEWESGAAAAMSAIEAEWAPSRDRAARIFTAVTKAT